MNSRLLLMLAAVLAVGYLSGCSVHNPQTAQEVRDFGNGFFKDSESFTVNRPYRSVKRSLITQSKKCLNIKTHSESGSVSRGYTSSDWVYNPKIEVTKSGVTLTLQRDLVGGNLMIMGDVPQGGTYAFVLDAAPISKGTTRIDFNWFKGAVSDNLYAAVMAWVKEGSTACPAM